MDLLEEIELCNKEKKVSRKEKTIWNCQHMEQIARFIS